MYEKGSELPIATSSTNPGVPGAAHHCGSDCAERSVSGSPAHAAEPDTLLSAQSLPQWWAAPGTPGFVDEVAMGNSLPFSYMGLVAGGVGVHDGILPATAPWPGVDEIRSPLAWYDSAAVVVGEGAAWNGFSGSLVQLSTFAEPPRGGKPRAAFTLVNGSSSVDRTGLLLERGDHDDWVRGGALTEARAGTGLLGLRGAHVCFLDLGRRFGSQTLSGTYAERGAANTTHRESKFLGTHGPTPPPFFGFEEAARGESGALAWSVEHGERRLSATLRRSHDHRESFESPLNDTLFDAAERFAQENAFVLEASDGSPGRGHGLKLELTQAQVARSADGLEPSGPRPARSAIPRTAWLAARLAHRYA